MSVWIVFAAALAASSACGTPTTPGNSWEFTGSLEEFTEAHHVPNHHDFQASKAGTATIRLTWANENVELEPHFTGQSCSEDKFFESLLEGSHQGNDCLSPFSYEGSGDLKLLEYLAEVKKDQKVRIWIIDWGPGPQEYKLTVDIS